MKGPQRRREIATGGKVRGADIYQLKIAIEDCSPPIWRRLQVPGYVTFAQLHRIIQSAFMWSDAHLHEFRIHDRIFSAPSADYIHSVIDERTVILAKEIQKEKLRFTYTYDFGDSWDHGITVEKIFAPRPGCHYPTCVAGKRRTPPEDCGGPGGYHNLLGVLANPHHPDFHELNEWVGPYFRPDEVDLEYVNSELKRMKFRKRIKPSAT
ncbi:MAG TPA: plasmid pRiA4b ORF-3 family protein [Bacteroidota bacterium]